MTSWAVVPPHLPILLYISSLLLVSFATNCKVSVRLSLRFFTVLLLMLLLLLLFQSAKRCEIVVRTLLWSIVISNHICVSSFPCKPFLISWESIPVIRDRWNFSAKAFLLDFEKCFMHYVLSCQRLIGHNLKTKTSELLNRNTVIIVFLV